jgi:hypothetical protein
MTARNWQKATDSRRKHRQGVDDISDMSTVGLSPWKPPAPKAASVSIDPETIITKVISCRCGRTAVIRIPMKWASGPFRCSQCGRANR